jgi:hypothetical protein
MLTHEQFLSVIEHDRWQDLVLSAGNIFFCFTLIPMLRHPSRPPSSDVHTHWARFAHWGFRVRDIALVAHCADPNGNGTSVARSGFQEVAAFGMRPQFAPSRTGCRLLDLQ